jgi:hypothetical protein
MTDTRIPKWIRNLPMLGTLARRLRAHGQPVVPFESSADYWRRRYVEGGDSGAGSYGKFAQFKARVLNELFVEQGIESVIEFGSGDGAQLALFEVPRYLGVDISADAVARCRERFAGQPGRHFITAEEYGGETADCALSLDVIYHLVEDQAFDAYMRRLFAAARRCVAIYSSNRIDEGRRDGEHVRHRLFTEWVATHQPGWVLSRHVPNDHPYRGDWRNGSFADFYLYRPTGQAAVMVPA